MKLLIFGGTSYLGSLLRPALEAQHTCYYFEAKPLPDAEERTFAGDLHDKALLEKAVHGMERIVWLGVGDVPDNEEERSDTKRTGAAHSADVFDGNVKGLYRLLHIAQFSGVLRFVYASSMSVYAECHKRDAYPLHELVPPDAWDTSGLSRRLGEAVGQACVRNRPECTFLALRLMYPCNQMDWPGNEYVPGRRSHPLGPNDTRRLFLAAIAFDRLGHYVLQASGDLEGESFPNSRATAVLGWRPQGN